MSDYDEPTRRLRPAHPEPSATMPGPLDLTRPETGEASAVGWPDTDEPEHTEVLSIDELFDAADRRGEARLAHGPPPAGADAPTWTAMPVVPVRSDLPPAPAAPRPGSVLAARVRSDASAAWQLGITRTQTWLRAQDNAVMLMTAAVGVVLIIVVALLGH